MALKKNKKVHLTNFPRLFKKCQGHEGLGSMRK